MSLFPEPVTYYGRQKKDKLGTYVDQVKKDKLGTYVDQVKKDKLGTYVDQVMECYLNITCMPTHFKCDVPK